MEIRKDGVWVFGTNRNGGLELEELAALVALLVVGVVFSLGIAFDHRLPKPPQPPHPAMEYRGEVALEDGLTAGLWCDDAEDCVVLTPDRKGRYLYHEKDTWPLSLGEGVVELSEPEDCVYGTYRIQDERLEVCR